MVRIFALAALALATVGLVGWSAFALVGLWGLPVVLWFGWGCGCVVGDATWRTWQRT